MKGNIQKLTRKGKPKTDKKKKADKNNCKNFKYKKEKE